MQKVVNNHSACKFWQPQMPIESSRRAQQSFSPEFRARILEVSTAFSQSCRTGG